MRILSHYLQQLFPEEQVLVRHLPISHQLGMFGLFFLLFSLLGMFIPADGFLAFDWLHFFGIGNIPPYYPPWARGLFSLLTWPTLIGFTLAAVSFASILRARHGVSLACVFLTLPVLWTIFLGQVDGLVLLGTLALPWSTPLALLKPQVSIFSFLARKSYLLGLCLTLLVSLTVWGFWPSQLFTVWMVHEGRYPNDIAMGWLGLPIALLLMWYSRGDVDMLMLAGTFTPPYLLPYNLIVVVPDIARLPPRMALIGWGLSWAPMAANWLGSGGWWFGWLFIVWLWSGLAVIRYSHTYIAMLYRKFGLAPQ